MPRRRAGIHLSDRTEQPSEQPWAPAAATHRWSSAALRQGHESGPSLRFPPHGTALLIQRTKSSQTLVTLLGEIAAARNVTPAQIAVAVQGDRYPAHLQARVGR